ncbi:MAG TPA: PHB depolymerase family esterase [Albitalea sp.]|nr:PHB depolymerase family esterase [Albitalea sp.]
MNPSFQRAMVEATRLTRAGDLRAAAALIQAALHGTAAPAAGREADVIDVEAHEVDIAARPATPPVLREGQFVAGCYTEAAGTREYKLYVPPGYHGQALPLVVMLHGCTQNPDDFAAGTGMNDAAFARDFFVLYPAQAQHANAARCWSWFKHNHQRRGRGEPALLAGMTRDVMKRYHIDAHRVYVAGLSAGGAMAAILGDEYPDLFAAVGVHSGLPPGAATDIKSAFAAMKGGAAARSAGHAPPTIVFHGDQDATVHPVNGEQVVAGSAGAAEAHTERARSDNGRAYTRRVYRDSSGRVVAEHWSVHGAGHAWSGGNARGSYTDAQGPDATEEMLRFFFAHTLHTAG